VSTPSRKLDHIRLAVDASIEHSRRPLFELVELVHVAVPENSLKAVDLRVEFLGRVLSAPIMITGMTGGHSVAAKINCSIARAAAELGLAMGVGSQRAGLEHPELAYTYSVVRDCGGGDVVVVANIGAPQLAEGYGVAEARKAIEMVDADALAVHLNAAQESFQPEGDTNYRGVLAAIKNLVENIDVPVIVKETGHGIGLEAALMLGSIGVNYFDVSGAGGTSWVKVEYYRALTVDKKLAEAARTFSDWGIATLQATIEARWAVPYSCIIASGGIRSGLDAAKAIAAGADLVGVALPVMRAYSERGEEGIRELLETYMYEIKTALFLTGARNLKELREKPLIIHEPLRSILERRGVYVDLYLDTLRKRVTPGKWCKPGGRPS